MALLCFSIASGGPILPPWWSDRPAIWGMSVYTAGIPIARTVAFAGGFVAQAIFVLALFEIL